MCAVALQQQALDRAEEGNRNDVIDILKEHMELFRQGSAITEKAP